MSGDIATVDFPPTRPGVGPNQTLAIAQVVYTATQAARGDRRDLRDRRQAIEVPTASGARSAGPVGRPYYPPGPAA